MGSSKFVASLAILSALLALTARGDDLTPIVEKICEEVNCGKGTCEVALGSPFNFKCVCDPNWKRTRSDDEQDLQFLPCVVPNCTLDYSCMPAPPPAPAAPYNLSFFDPCYWIYCGEGTCTKNQTYTHTCQCNTGYSNLLDVAQFPCYSSCALGSDCERLGIKVSNSTSSTDGGNQATSFLPGKFHWVSILLMSGAMALWS